MSGGRLVVLDRLGREVKKYPLLSGLATLGSDPRCDIRVMLASVSGHHATVVVHNNQTVVRNVGSGETLVNGVSVSVAALRHGDVITVGERSLRWEYAEPAGRRSAALHPALVVPSRRGRGRAGASTPGGGAGRGRRARGSEAAPAPLRSPALQLALEMHHRASMPGNAGGKQVAIVQPQRRDTTEQNEVRARPSPQGKRQRASAGDAASASASANTSASASASASARSGASARASMSAPSKAEQWMQQRRPARKSAPLRLLLLRRSAAAGDSPVRKIRPPSEIDHTKQAALMLMTGHTPKPKSPSPKKSVGRKTPSFLVKKPSPSRRTPRGRASAAASARRSQATPKEQATPKGQATPRGQATPATPGPASARRSAKKSIAEQTVSVRLSGSVSDSSRVSQVSQASLGSPRRSAMKDPKRPRARLGDTIKFDLSNLDHYDKDDTAEANETSATDDDITLHYSETSADRTPSPRRSIHSRSGRMLEKSLGASLAASPAASPARRSAAAAAPSPRRSTQRSSIIVRKALDASAASDASVATAFRTRTLSPRSPQLETYSIVDLVSDDSARSASVYGSADGSALYGTPRDSAGRRTRSTIDPSTLVGSSTPYVAKARSSSMRSRKSARSSAASRRSKSLSTPENASTHISVNSTRLSRASKSRSRLTDTDLLLISLSDNSQVEDVSPLSSRRVSRSSKSIVASPTASPVANGSFQSEKSSGRRSGARSTEASPAADRSIASSASSPAGRRGTRSTDASPIIGRKTKSTRASPAIGRRTKSNQGSPVIGRATASAPASPAARRTPKSHQASPDQSVDLASPAGRSPGSKRRSTRGGGDDGAPGGVSTPENRRSPPEIGTPVLDIQSLLNSSLSSSKAQARRGRATADAKRRTIGVIRSERAHRSRVQSRSLGFTARRGALRLSRDSDAAPAAPAAPAGDDTVTPRSAVKLAPEAVKNKHSTAKKPQSRRSIIDTLDESDVVKQLFASPVRRKLSRSMTEYSRRGDDDDAPRRPTRATLAAAPPPVSPLEHSVAVTPEVFVSPLASPGGSPASPPSPDLAGVARLLRRRSPRDDLRDVRGVRALLRSPRSPRDDLRRVSGVKRLMRRAEPRDDLTDVRGVRGLFRADRPAVSPNMSGVEALFDESVPAAEALFDRMVGRPPIRAVYSRSLVGRAPPRPKTRATSLHAPADLAAADVEAWLEAELQRRLQPAGAGRELRKLATDTVAGAEPLRASRGRARPVSDAYSARRLPLKKRSLPARLPLKKRLVHSTPVKGRASAAAPDLGRVSPIAPNDVSIGSEPSTLPMTDSTASRRATRVVVEIEKPSPRSSKASPGAKSPPRGKPSPRSAKYSPRSALISPRSTKSSPKTAKPSPKTTNPSPKNAKLSPKSAKPSPRTVKATPARPTASPQATTTARVAEASPAPRATRARGNTKKRRSSLVIGKKTPGMSPQPAARARRARAEPKDAPVRASKVSPVQAPKVSAVKAPKVSPKKPRATRAKEEKPAPPKQTTPKRTTPKRTTRAKVQRSTVVVAKPSPQLKPQGRSRARVEIASEAKVEAPKTRTKRSSEPKPPATEPAPKRARKTTAAEKTIEEVESKTKRRKVQSPKESPKKTRRAAPAEAEPRGRRARATETKSEVTTSPAPKRARKTQVAPEPEPKTNSRKTRGKEDEDKKTKGRKTEVEVKVVEDKKKTEKEPAKAGGRRKGVEAQASTQSEPARRRGRAVPDAPAAATEVKSRKRKSTAEDLEPAKISKVAEPKARKGRATAVASSEPQPTGARQKRGAKATQVAQVAPVAQVAQPAKTAQVGARSRRGQATVASPAPATTRTTRNKETAKETVPKTNSRKKKTEVVASPVKQAAAKSPASRRSRQTTRGKAEPAIVPVKTTSRSRRR